MEKINYMHKMFLHAVNRYVYCIRYSLKHNIIQYVIYNDIYTIYIFELIDYAFIAFNKEANPFVKTDDVCES